MRAQGRLCRLQGILALPYNSPVRYTRQRFAIDMPHDHAWQFDDPTPVPGTGEVRCCRGATTDRTVNGPTASIVD